MILTACLQGIQPCELKGNRHQWLGNLVFRLAEKEKKWDLWKRSPNTFWGIQNHKFPSRWQMLSQKHKEIHEGCSHSGANWEYDEMCQPISWLYVDTSRCDYLVPCLWHDSQCSFWRVIPICTKILQPCWWLHLPWQYPTRWKPNYTEWSHSYHIRHLQAFCCFHSRSRTGCTFPLNMQDAKVLRLILTELGHPQPPTPIHIDNTTQSELSTTQSSNKDHKQWKWDTSGC